MERALIGEFEALLDHLSSRVSTGNLGELTAIAALPMRIRGYGHVKEAAVDAYRADLAKHLAKLADDAVPSGRPQGARASQKSRLRRS
jgi:indolepyruvate ferredoxin oxidoreductase